MTGDERHHHRGSGTFNEYLAPLIKNTGINMVAFAAISVINLLLVPFLIGAYGIEGFGLLALLRYLMPKGVFSFLDLGISESVTRQVATLGAKHDGMRAERVVAVGALALLVLGAVAAGAFLTASASLPAGLLNLSPAEWDTIARIFGWAGVAMFILFPGLAFEAALKGREAFHLVRLVEFLGVALYASVAFVLVKAGASIEWVALAFLGAHVTQSLAYGIFVTAGLSGSGVRLRGISRDDWRDVLHVAPVIFKSKVLGAVQGNAAPLILMPMAGTGAVGLYDALMRLPRFAKSVIGLTNSAVLPVSARLEGLSKHSELASVVRYGTLMTFAITAPPLLFGVWYAPLIIDLWLGSDFVEYGRLLSLAFVWPLIMCFIGFGVTMMVARSHALRRLNNISTVQVTSFLILGTALGLKLGATGFIAATVLTQALVLPAQFFLIAREYRVSYAGFSRPVALIAGAFVPAMAAAWLLPVPRGLGTAVLALAFWCTWAWLIVFRFGMNDAERAKLRGWLGGMRQGTAGLT